MVDVVRACMAVGASMLVLANILATKIIELSIPIFDTITFSGGVLPIAIMFLCTDIISERAGLAAAKESALIAVGAVVASFGMIELTTLLPYAGGVPQNAFTVVLDNSMTLMLASVTTAFVSQIMDVYLFEHIRSALPSHKWIRNLGSTAISQSVDTTLFTVLAFAALPPIFGGSVLPFSVITSIIAVEYGVKLCIAIIDTPVFYALTKNE